MIARLLHTLRSRFNQRRPNPITILRPRIVERDGLAYITFTKG
jgi:hypothetical protein